ncbi:retrovirus-related pol polyprotein from transposon TNT 1-94, partial [Tanacetum coccineum]
EPSTPTNVHAEENNNNQAEFTNPFCTLVQKIHPLTQVRGDPSKPVQTRRQLATDPEMCIFALTVSIVEPKNIKEAMADSAWIEAMHDELHQFDRLQVWELVDKPFGKNVIKLKWLVRKIVYVYNTTRQINDKILEEIFPGRMSQRGCN